MDSHLPAYPPGDHRPGAHVPPATPLPPATRRLALLAGLAVILGFAGGGAAWVLLHLITLLTNLALWHTLSTTPRSFADYRPNWALPVAAVAGAVVIGLLARVAPVIRGHGIPEAMEAVLTRRSKVTARTALAKPISAAIAIGTGAPFGAEGPIIVTGGSIGSLLGQVVPVSASERKILLAAGAAAGMAATFGAPLASVVLAFELLVFEFSVRALIPLVVSASIAGSLHGALLGHGPLFRVPPGDLSGLRVLPAFALVGLAAGGLAIVIGRGLFLVERGYRRLPVNELWHPAIGALGFAAVGLVVPRVLGVGYDVIGDVLNGRLALATVAVLAGAKLVAWWLALGSGTSGGTLAPILAISASFGTVVGAGLNRVLPGPPIALTVFALVTMAATFGAATGASLTAIVFTFELTRDYDVVLPLMLATVLADLVCSAVNPDTLMTEKLRRRGLRVGRHLGPDPFESTLVAAAMTPLAPADGATPPASPSGPEATVAADVPARAALHLLVERDLEAVGVVDGHGRLVGWCTRADLLHLRHRQRDLDRREPGLLARRPGAANRAKGTNGTDGAAGTAGPDELDADLARLRGPALRRFRPRDGRPRRARAER